jgi:hypothetical protein
VAKIAEALAVPEDDVVQMNRRLAAPDHSLNAPRASTATASGRTGWWTTPRTRKCSWPRARSWASAGCCSPMP